MHENCDFSLSPTLSKTVAIVLFYVSSVIIEISSYFMASFIYVMNNSCMGFPGGSDDKESTCNAGETFSPGVGKIPWKREWLPTSVFLPGEFHGQRSLAGYSP